MFRRLIALAGLACAIGLTALPTRAELVEEIVAWVNGDIITLSELREEEEVKLADAYRRLEGEELERALADIKANLLLDMIHTRILVDEANRLYDIDKMADSLYEDFRKSQEVESEEEFERMLAREGVTVAEAKRRLLRTYAPSEVLRVQIANRTAISDAAVRAHYEANPDEFLEPATVTLREIVILAEDDAAKADRRVEAEAVLERLRGGESFEKVAEEVSDAGTAAEGGLFGPLERKDLAERLADPAFTLPLGEISGIIEAPYGFHIVQVVERKDERMRPLEEVREPLRAYLADKQFREQVDEYLEKARAEAEWCVKPGYRDRLPIPAPQDCDRL